MPQNDMGGLAARPVPPQPEPSLISRILGAFSGPALPDNVVQGQKILAKEAPDIATTPIQPYGALSRLTAPQAEGYVVPGFGKTIYINPELMKGKSDQEVADTLLHELTHVRQNKSRSVIDNILQTFGQQGPYGQRPDEMEAFQAEADRRTKMGRPAIFGTPHFVDDSQESQGDIYLPNARPIPRK